MRSLAETKPANMPVPLAPRAGQEEVVNSNGGRPARRREETTVFSAEIDPAGNLERQYFSDIWQIPLLTLEKEITFAQQIEAGKKAKQRLGVMQVEDTMQQEAIAQGEEARRRLTESNLRLVISIAKHYVENGLPLLDLVQEGNIGLMRAVEKYDWRWGYRFSTYAYWWIKQGVIRAIVGQSRTIRLPYHVGEALIGNIYDVQHRLWQQLEREATVDEIAKETGIPVKNITGYLQANVPPASLDLVDPDTGQTSGEKLETDGIRGVPLEEGEASAFNRELREGLERAFGEAGLTPREAYVLRLRFGLKDGQTHTLEKTGAILGTSRERVRQIEAGALQRLRDPSVMRKLKEFINEL